MPVENVAVRADIDMIKTVIRNLISNAIKLAMRFGSSGVADRGRWYGNRKCER